jgi:DNA-directed RNA polymerase specialized sigma24 family protein
VTDPNLTRILEIVERLDATKLQRRILRGEAPEIIADLLTRLPRGLTITEISRVTDLPLSTVHRVLHEADWAVRKEEDGLLWVRRRGTT